MSDLVAVENANIAGSLGLTTQIAALQAKLTVLTDFNDRLQVLRQIPAVLVRPPTVELSPRLDQVMHPPTLRREFQTVKEVAGTLKSAPVQEALAFARDSEQKDKTGLTIARSCETRKRKRAPSPESPQPYRSFEPKHKSLLPEIEEGLPPVRLAGLVAYIKEYSTSERAVKVQIYSPSRDRPLVCPVVLRCIIRDVATIYLTLGEVTKGDPLAVESATAFGPREKRPPHSQSEYMVCQKLSQQIAKMIQSHPQAPLRTILNLLCAYEGLFVQRCAVCDRVLSAEGHLPPVSRVWTKLADGAMGWEARHTTCLRP